MEAILVSFEEWKKGYFLWISSFTDTFLVFDAIDPENIFILLLNEYICSKLYLFSTISNIYHIFKN